MSSLIWRIKNYEDLTKEELYKILKVRQEVFIVEQTCYYLDADGYDQKSLHFWAEQDGEILAYCRIFSKGIKYPETSLGRVLTSEKGRGKNLGRQMMKYAVEIIENQYKTSEIRISAQDYLISFYKEFGFEDTGKKYIEDLIPHTEMLRK